MASQNRDTASEPRLEFPVFKHRLDNGLSILVLEDRTIPNVALYLFYRVGSRNERPGITGLSHFLEHMMFNGSAKYGPKEFDRVMEAAGGRNNAYTSRNITAYQDWFPSEALELVFDLESDRMANLAFEAGMVESERGVVASERKMSTENDNLGLLDEQLWAAAYTAHPYQWPIIGWMADIENWKLEDLHEYFRTYYAPNNALLVLVGDMRQDEVLKLAEEHFGSIPTQVPPRPVTTREPAQIGERRVHVRKAAQLPSLMIAYHIPEATHADLYPLQVFRGTLLQGQSSRLYQRLIDREQMAIAVNGGFELSLDPTLFYFTVQIKGGVETVDVERVIFDELERLAREPLPKAELEKVKNMLLAGFYRGLKTISGKANALGNFELLLGNYGRLFQMADQYEKVTAEDVHAVAQRYFEDKNRTVATLVPEG